MSQQKGSFRKSPQSSVGFKFLIILVIFKRFLLCRVHILDGIINRDPFCCDKYRTLFAATSKRPFLLRYTVYARTINRNVDTICDVICHWLPTYPTFWAPKCRNTQKSGQCVLCVFFCGYKFFLIQQKFKRVCVFLLRNRTFFIAFISNGLIAYLFFNGSNKNTGVYLWLSSLFFINKKKPLIQGGPQI